MRKILYIVIAMMALLTSSQVFAATQSCAPAQQTPSSTTNPKPRASHEKRSIMELPLFERAVLIIKKFETLHKPKHWPYVGYGHQVQPGEPYRRGVQLTEAQADALLRKDYAKFCSLYEKYGKDKYLLAALAYNCGPGVVNKSSVLRLLKSGNRNIFKAYTSHCHYKGKRHNGLLQRRITEFYSLFVP